MLSRRHRVVSIRGTVLPTGPLAAQPVRWLTVHGLNSLRPALAGRPFAHPMSSPFCLRSSARFFIASWLFALAVPLTSLAAEILSVHLKFDFGSGKLAAGYTQILPDTLYSPERGFGFEPGATVTAVDRGGNDSLRGDFITSDKPFLF